MLGVRDIYDIFHENKLVGFCGTYYNSLSLPFTILGTPKKNFFGDFLSADFLQKLCRVNKIKGEL